MSATEVIVPLSVEMDMDIFRSPRVAIVDVVWTFQLYGQESAGDFIVQQ